MKDKILKLTGHKNLKSFYSAFPTEEAFMAKYGGEFKKLLKAEGGIGMFADEVDQPLQLEKWMTNDRNFISSSTKQGFDINSLSPYIQLPGQLIQGIQNINSERKKRKSAEQWANVSDVVLQAARTKDEIPERKYVRPEDVINTGEEFFPIYGVGANVLKHGGEIQNTYAPNTLYDDLEYVPVRANNGIDVWSKGAGITNNLITGIGGENEGGNLGSTLGGTAGTLIGGPLGGAIGSVAGNLLGRALDPNPRKTKAAQQRFDRNMTNLTFADGVQQQYSSFMRTGGNLKQNTMDGDLETHWGGYAEPISQNPYLPEGGETVMFRGQSHESSDGKGNTGIGVTYGNSPVEVEGGEPAVKLQNGGQDTNLTVFGNLDIPDELIPLLGDTNAKGKKFKNYVADLSKTEAKQNKIVDKSTEELSSLEISSPFDKLKFNSNKAMLTGADMKLKNIAEKKTKASILQNAINETAEESGLSAEHLSKGKIKKAKGGTGVLKSDANDSFLEYFPQPTLFPNIQNNNVYSPPVSNTDLINKYFSNERGFTEEDRKKAYEVMMGESSGNSKAVGVNTNPKITNPKGQYWGSKDTGLFQINSVAHPEYYQKGDLTNPEYNVQSAAEIALRAKKAGKDPFSPWVSYKKPTVAQAREEIQPISPIKSFPTPRLASQPVNTNQLKTSSVKPVSPVDDEGSGFDFMDVLSGLVPYLRPSDAEHLDPRQLAGEMYAMSHNQIEPVYAQTIQPDLSVPYDISYQDLLNANQNDYRAVSKMLQNNPAALSQLNANKYAANEKVLGEQFRQNQGEKSRVYEKNRDILNQTKLQNLGILDTQQQRQSLAKSNTKAVAQKALESISNKYMQNQLENRTLQTYENLYNYRFDPRFRAVNMNAPAQFNIPTVTEQDATVPSYGLNDYEKMKALITNYETQKKQQGKSYAKKTGKNGSIVKAMK